MLVEKPGQLTFPILQKLLSGVLVVSDQEAMNAVAVAHEELKITVEPGGAVALAAALSGKIDLCGKTVAAVCTGGNVDTDVFMQSLRTA